MVVSGRVRLAAGLTIAVGVAGASGGVVGAAPTAAAPVSLTLTYTCSFPVVNNRLATVEIDADVPASTVEGRPTARFVVNATAPVSAAAAGQLRLIGMRSVEGTADAKVVVAAPQGDIDVALPITVRRTTIPASGPFRAAASGTAPALTFSRPGRARIIVGDVTLHLTARDANGNVTFPGRFDAPCRRNPGQDNVLASFDITGVGRTPGPVASSSAGPRPSRTARSTPPRGGGATTDAPTGPARPGAPGTTTTTGPTRSATAGPTTGPASGPTMSPSVGEQTSPAMRPASGSARQATAEDGPADLSHRTSVTGGRPTAVLILAVVGILAVGTVVVAGVFRVRRAGMRRRTP